jgi:hypothetical protein
VEEESEDPTEEGDEDDELSPSVSATGGNSTNGMGRGVQTGPEAEREGAPLGSIDLHDPESVSRI